MSLEQIDATVGQVNTIQGEVSLVRAGQAPVALKEGMEIRHGDVLKASTGSSASVVIPGAANQVSSTLDIQNGAEAKVNFDPNAGKGGQVSIERLSDEGTGTLTMTQDGPGENVAAVVQGEESGVVSGLFGAGLMAGGSLFVPGLGAVAAGAFVASSLDDNTDGSSGGNPNANPIPTPADTVGGVIGTVENLSTNLDNLTESIPVVGTLVDTITDVLAGNGGNPSLIPPLVGGVTNSLLDITNQLANATDGIPVIGELTDVLSQILQGDNSGGLSGILSGLGNGLDNALASTPLAPLGDVLNTVLNGTDSLNLGPLSGGLVGGLETVADALSGLGGNTPLADVTQLLADVVGTSGDANTSVGGGLLGGNLLGGLLSGGEALSQIPILGDVLGQVTSIASNAGGDGGLLGALPLDPSKLAQGLA